MVFCSADGARLFFECDRAMHGVSALASLHLCAPLCDAARAALRCQVGAHWATLCAGYAGRRVLPDRGGGASLVDAYTSGYAPAEIVCILTVDAPSLHEDFDAWLADNLPQILHEVQAPCFGDSTDRIR
ncbi:uncharacterized protein [Aegilops tauschii subsp. strangulata]|uniref:uncharacterized protein n=1 Tax=Aegilops tauschii subsp. strangulata TaxID=200361 RepID=UPI003CC8BB1B